MIYQVFNSVLFSVIGGRSLDSSKIITCSMGIDNESMLSPEIALRGDGCTIHQRANRQSHVSEASFVIIWWLVVLQHIQMSDNFALYV